MLRPLTWPLSQWRPGGRQAGWTCSRPPAAAHSRRAPEAGATGSARRSLAARARAGPLPPFCRVYLLPRLLWKEWLPLLPPLPRWRQVGPPPCARRLCSSPPHPHRLWPHLHVEPLRWGAPPLCFSDPGHAFLRRALCLQSRTTSAIAQLPTPAVVSSYAKQSCHRILATVGAAWS